jgi:small subunit ribosomal protein S17
MNETTETAPPAAAKKPALKRTLVGRVTSTKMQKTVTVLVERKVKHPVYGKYLVHSTKLHAHTEMELADGDMVEIQESRPISKTKAWVVMRKVPAPA